MAASVLTDKQIAEEDKFMKGLPRVNWGAFLMPPIWGAANGIWAAIAFYPLWLIADNVLYAAYSEPTALNVVVAVIMAIVTFAVTLAFSIVSQPFAAHRAENMGVSRETYLKRQRRWVVISAIIAVAMVAAATYYNMVIRPTMGA